MCHIPAIELHFLLECNFIINYLYHVVAGFVFSENLDEILQFDVIVMTRFAGGFLDSWLGFWFYALYDLFRKMVVLRQADSNEGIDQLLLAERSFAISIPGQEKIFGNLDMLFLECFSIQVLIRNAQIFLFFAYTVIVSLDQLCLQLTLRQLLPFLHPSLRLDLAYVPECSHLFHFVTEHLARLNHVLQSLFIDERVYFIDLSQLLFFTGHYALCSLKSLLKLIGQFSSISGLHGAHEIEFVLFLCLIWPD